MQTLFQKKINYLFEQLEMKGREREFVALFSKKKHKYSARKKVVIDKWLYGKMKKNPYWKYQEYPISKKKINGFVVFEEYCFKDEESLEVFKERVDSYVLNRNLIYSLKEEFEYRYIYYFNIYRKEMFFLELNIIRKKSNGHYIIELTPSNFYKNRGVENYIGILIKNENHYYISAKNRFEIVTFYFLTNRGFESNKIVYGLSLELSYKNLLPTAKKRAITKEKLTKEEKERLYLYLNETEYLISDEVFDNNQDYIDNFYKKIANLNSFVKKIKSILSEDIKKDNSLKIFYERFDYLDKFLVEQDKKDYNILERLIGIWYHYYYGSIKNSDNSLIIWKSKLIIDRNGEVKYIDNNGKVLLSGMINTTFNKKQPFIYLTDIDSESLALITFDIKDIYRGIFRVAILDKKLSSSFNMVSFGFFSKEKLQNSLVKEILGEENKILIEEYDIQDRINNYFHNKNYFG